MLLSDSFVGPVVHPDLYDRNVVKNVGNDPESRASWNCVAKTECNLQNHLSQKLCNPSGSDISSFTSVKNFKSITQHADHILRQKSAVAPGFEISRLTATISKTFPFPVYTPLVFRKVLFWLYQSHRNNNKIMPVNLKWPPIQNGGLHITSQ